ncbi:MAG TPA: tyrosine-type recombinase/integrase [Dehalococcoidia bacterium]|nr:tyrosine-type recombinase/integrase [Dehalococcoidia bacterium]
MGLVDYFVRPKTIDRIRASWVGSTIERYVDWLSQHGYSPRNVWRRVPLLMRFGDFARSRGASRCADLPEHVDAFVAWWAAERQHLRQPRCRYEVEARNPVEQMLRLAVPGFEGRRSQNRSEPFQKQAPRFWEYLRRERGLSDVTIRAYCIQLGMFESYLKKLSLGRLQQVSPLVLSGFLADRSKKQGKKALKVTCAALRTFLRYAFRERLLRRDLAGAVESPRTYRLADLPRAITWDEVHRMLAVVDQRTPLGKRDYAILLLLVTYGLRAREVAALRLEDIDWDRALLHVGTRKAGHSTTYPLAKAVGDALVEYLRHARPKDGPRSVFLRALAPHGAMTFESVAERATHYLRKAGITASRPGSHTLRHTCVQRLVDADFSLKNIGDYVGHSAPQSTQVYAKVALRPLREVALGDVEELL